MKHIVTLVALIAIGNFASADVIEWENLGGPPGGLGYDVRIDPVNPLIMYVTDNFAGVVKSTDGGNTWEQKNTGIDAASGPTGDAIPIFSLTIDPSDHNTLWAGTTNERGVFRSTDAAESWVRKDNGITEASGITVRSFTIDPNDSDIIYCGTEIASGEQGLEFGKQSGKIYKTTDGGENWFEVWAGDSLARHIIIDPADSDIVYAGTGIFDAEAVNSNLPATPGGVGVLKSTNAGATWSQINTGLGNLFVGYLAMHPADNSVLYAATGMHSASLGGFNGGLYVTTNAGASWTSLMPNDAVLTAARISSADPSVRYAGSAEAIWRSDNSGSTWQRYSQDGQYGPPGIRAGVPIDLTIDPSDPLHIYVNNYGGGVFQSFDGGESWVDSSKGYSGAQLHDLAISQRDYEQVYAIGRSGPFRSNDGGSSWSGLAFSPAQFGEWYAIECAPGSHDTIIASDEHQGVLLKSDDAGASWQEVFRHPQVDAGDVENRHGFKALRFAPSDANIVYAGMSNDRNRVDTNDISFGIYFSDDGGVSWEQRNSGISGLSNLNIHDVAVNPSDPGTAYAATNDSGVFKTTNFGQSWTQVNSGFGPVPPDLDIRSLEIDPTNPDRILAGLEDGGIYLSLDAGTTWSSVSAGMDPWASIRDIVINPLNPDIIIAADWHTGIYITVTGTQPWTQANVGFSTRAVTTLTYSWGGGALYAGTDGGGAFRALLDSDEDGLLDIEENIDDNRFLSPNETDPHNPDTDGDGLDDGLDAFPANASETVDTDDDGMGDNFEQSIIDADLGDSINTLLDVLPGDDFDEDGSSNLSEFLNGTDPLDPASRLPLGESLIFIAILMITTLMLFRVKKQMTNSISLD